MMTDWKLSLDGVNIAQVMNFTAATERTKVLTRLYNGEYLAQTIGQTTQRPSITIRVDSQAELEAVNEAEATCAVLTLTYKDKIYTGYIVDKPSWSPMIRGKVYKTTVEFAVISEADAT